MEWISENAVLILSVLWGLSETLSLIPAVKANGVFQLVVGVLGKLKQIVGPK